jgi:hypothetical protein
MRGNLVLILISTTAWIVPVQDGPRPTLEDLGWLAGCWRRESGGLVSEEQWMKPLGRTLLGVSRTVRDGMLVEYEYLRIVEDTTGGMHYVAWPSRQRETWFMLVKSTKEEFVFENPEHDFPQRIIYRRVGADSLVARVEGVVNEQHRGRDFPMRRVACD